MSVIQNMRELWVFAKARKRLWLWPLVVLMALLGGIFVAAQSSAISPFIYTLF